MPKYRRIRGFTLIELITTMVLLSVVAVTAVAKFQDISTEAENTMFDYIYSIVSNYLTNANGFQYALLGSPDRFTDVVLNGVSVNYRDGFIRRTTDNSHVPAGTPNSNSHATRLWYIIFISPPPVIARNNNTGTGWSMYQGNVNCGVNRSRCWKYREANIVRAVITYEFTTGTVTLDKNP